MTSTIGLRVLTLEAQHVFFLSLLFTVKKLLGNNFNPFLRGKGCDGSNFMVQVGFDQIVPWENGRRHCVVSVGKEDT